ncbi:HWE histidine kinase domain-containing protein [Parvularcula dongshanensis]|uniref:histidine kinase n=1 Tax=Parvularcula dongshanensis TaxID=1173995 RepID=A0A840I3J4_9PROT|nr:HWE histidine kinase domain-containing protein [Parvularcula dongshanensis]MBB4658843.1 two-component sensor histidine kinase [Parvularcula dongshanensis]
MDAAEGLGFSALDTEGGRTVLRPGLPGLPDRFGLLTLMRGLEPAARASLAVALRSPRQGPFDVRFVRAGTSYAARVDRKEGGFRGVAWVANSALPSSTLLSRMPLPIGIAARDGRILTAGKDVVRRRNLQAISPDSAPMIEAALGTVDQGPQTVRLSGHDEPRPWHASLVLEALPAERVLFCLIDETAQRAASDRADQAVRELNHRIRNAMSVITALISLSAPHADNVGAFAAATLARIGALDKAYSLTGANPHEPHRYQTEVSLGALCRAIVGDEQAGVTIHDTDIAVTPGQATAIGLILHELATNARRHGTLTAPGGWLEVAFDRTEDGYRIRWTEGGANPPAEAEERFGLSIVRAFSTNYLNGRTDWTPTDEGLIVTIHAAAD